MARKSRTEEEILARVPAARARAREAARVEPRAVDAYLDAERGRVVIELTNGCAFAFPVAEGRGLEGATAEQLGAVELDPGGEGLHWEALDADISVPGIIARLLNLGEWAPRYLGAVRSEAKARAARENGKLGGRPRKERPGSERSVEYGEAEADVPAVRERPSE